MRLLVAGCGDLGTRLGLLWINAGGQVLAWRRQPQGLPSSFERMAIDLCEPIPASAVDEEITAIAYVASADARTPEAYRQTYVEGLKRLIDGVPSACARLVFTSSTAVYGEDHGGWVDEASGTHPASFNGEVLLEAEALLGDVPGAALARLSGLYGPGRERMLRRALAGDVGSARWGNRVHIDDAAAALLHMLTMRPPVGVLCVSDDAPTQDAEVLARLRQVHGMVEPPAAAMDALQSGRRVSNRRLRESGFTCRYPNFAVGYSSLVANRLSETALL